VSQGWQNHFSFGQAKIVQAWCTYAELWNSRLYMQSAEKFWW